MIDWLCRELPGRPVYLFTDEAVAFYNRLGFAE